MSSVANFAIIRHHLNNRFSETPTSLAEYSFVAASIYLSLSYFLPPTFASAFLARLAVQYNNLLEEPGYIAGCKGV